MVRNDDEQSSLFTRMDNIEGRLSALELTIISMVQEIKRLSFKFDDRSLADREYRRGHEYSSNNFSSPPLTGNPHLPPSPYHHIMRQLIFLYHLHHRITHSDHPHITQQLIFLNHHCYTPLQHQRVYSLCCSKITVQPKGPWQYTIEGLGAPSQKTSLLGGVAQILINPRPSPPAPPRTKSLPAAQLSSHWKIKCSIEIQLFTAWGYDTPYVKYCSWSLLHTAW